MFAQLQQTAWEFHDKARERYRKLGVVGKSLVWVWVGLHVVMIGVFWRYGEAISACASFFFPLLPPLAFSLLFLYTSCPAALCHRSGHSTGTL